MQYSTSITLEDQPLKALLDALATRLELTLDASAIDGLASLTEAASADAGRLTLEGHVVVTVQIGAEGATLQLDGNRRRIKLGQAIHKAWAGAYGPDAPVAEQAQRQAVFERSLADL
ncbi:MAG: hypothetical protein ACI9WU_001104 [Myxococcota bacterium]|jgi:hypothetical protein